MASKIRILDEVVANQIAAGEVIERPASVVKELVENSIDAGSTRLQVEIIDGGRTSIRILDNGEGISKDDVVTAFERHATSKIQEAADLFAIRTLGFRGEALGSIAAISKVTIRTRTADEPVGTQMRIEGGEIKDQREVGMAVGTDFLVEDLFYNTPARYKYMKKVNTEMGQISDLFNRIAVAEPQISMSLAHNGRLINRTPGTGRLLDTLLSLHGRELVEDLVEVDYEDSYVKVWGYVTKPTTYRSSRKHQSFYVNGRFVRSTILSRGVREAYGNLLPHNRHPLAFLFIKINAIHVDVNVHPAKLEIKFSRPEIVSDVLTKGIRLALQDGEHLPTFAPMEKLKKRVEKEEVELTPLFNEDDELEDEDQGDTKFDTDADAGMDASTYRADASTDAGVGILSNKNETPSGEPSPEEVRYTQGESGASRLRDRLAQLNYEKKNWDPQQRRYDEDDRYRRGGSGGQYPGGPRAGGEQNSGATKSGRGMAEGQGSSVQRSSQYGQGSVTSGHGLVGDSGQSDAEQVQDRPTHDEERHMGQSHNQPSDQGNNADSSELNSGVRQQVDGHTEFDQKEEPADQQPHFTGDVNGDVNFPQHSGEGPIEQSTTKGAKNTGFFIARLLPIGQIHSTYIIAQGKDGFYVIDQHVAHERVLYEKFMRDFREKGVPSQTLLIPITLELTFKEIQSIEENEELFQQMGFEVEHFGGNTVLVRSAPKRVDERPDKDLFLEILDLILEEKNANDRARLYDKLITTMSCKGAIKAGEHLEQGEMIQLLKRLSQTENPRFCPHGRPILFHITEHDLLKAFQRI